MVALAKEYSTEKSPAFVNALLDKILKESEAAHAAPSTPASAPAPSAPTPSPEDAGIDTSADGEG
ncbi:MAG: transcription antitermination factor NusB [Phycisphaerales bacterium]